jgi:uroporphyrinogen III methyltransferase/synthase
MTRASTVYLIGAGPGDPGLITVRGLQCLTSADVVLYDHLVHARLLRHARPDAEKIDVGVAAPQPLEQEAICYLLAEKAREGKTVARPSGAIRSCSIAPVRKRCSCTNRACASR